MTVLAESTEFPSHEVDGLKDFPKVDNKSYLRTLNHEDLSEIGNYKIARSLKEVSMNLTDQDLLY